ncbi:thioredoxin 1 [Streptacidiphilus sp. MAP12-20]|uniref:thioredoxin family protein n=1 Tax=Streptacidiphilus sp. MAP12-20 TaxID=3156299 RepID=UPI0035176DF0
MAGTSELVAAVGDADFAAQVLASELPVLVEFTADWCPPCRMMAPVLAELAAERVAELRVVTVDVDVNPETQAGYGVLSMPTMMLFRDGEPIWSAVGARPKRKLGQELTDAIARARAAA